VVFTSSPLAFRSVAKVLLTPFRKANDWVFASPETEGRKPYWPETHLKYHVQPAAKRLGITKLRKDRDQKMWVFTTLMTLRGSSLTQDFVKALNFIDVVFYKNESVRTKWKNLLTHLSSEAYKAEPVAESTLEKTRDLPAELLVEMAEDLGLGYNFTHIKSNAYYPQALVTTDTDNFVLRKKLIAALNGQGVLSVKLVEDAPAPAASTAIGKFIMPPKK
jgi:hypothetical protein